MGEQGAISVIIPVYNGERYLGEAIESVLAQNYQPLEIIVVDDGSTDKSATVAKSFPNIHYVWQAQAGASQARNQGVVLASGEWLAFLDADDLWSADKLTKQGQVLANEPAIDMVFGQVQQFYSPELEVATTRSPVLGYEPLAGYHVGAMLIRRKAFDRVGGFDPHWQVAHFLDWYARAQAVGLKSLLLPEVVMKRRIHTTNLGIRAYDTARREYLRIAKSRLDQHPARRMANG